jgi:hypothetical protein
MVPSVITPEIVEPLISTCDPVVSETSRGLERLRVTVGISVAGVSFVFGIGTAPPVANVTDAIPEAVDLLITVPAEILGTTWLGYVNTIDGEPDAAVPVTTPVIPATFTFAFVRTSGKVPVTEIVFVVDGAVSAVTSVATMMGVAALFAHAWTLAEVTDGA